MCSNIEGYQSDLDDNLKLLEEAIEKEKDIPHVPLNQEDYNRFFVYVNDLWLVNKRLYLYAVDLCVIIEQSITNPRSCSVIYLIRYSISHKHYTN